MLENSNLPGKRANIELALAFADFIEEKATDTSEVLRYCLRLISENPEDRNEKGNQEFLPFCAIIALGRIGKIDSAIKPYVLELLKLHACDDRWRIREAVAMALEDLLSRETQQTLQSLVYWVNDDNYLVLRALIAGLASPVLMKNPDYAQQALIIHRKIICKVDKESSVRSDDLKTLIKGLSYTLSIVITGIEEQGFAYLEELIHSDNPVVQKIARENLKKNRLMRLNKDRVIELQAGQRQAGG